MASLLQNTIFGNNRYRANTFIGGVSATLNTPELVASKLGVSSTRIKAFKIVGSNIEFAVVGGTYNIGRNTFSGDTAITYYYDNAGLVFFIGASAFANCINLTNVKFNNWTQTSGGNTFLGCSKLDADFTALRSITHGSTFQGCRSLKSSSFNWSALTAVADASFNDCSGLTGAIVLTMSGTLGSSAFRGTNISSFKGNDITTIGHGAFALAVLLEYFEANAVVTINSINTNNQTFQGVPCKTYNFPALQSIGESAYKNNTFIESFTANNLKNIGVQTFSSCVNLSTCVIPNIEVLGGGSFLGCTSLPNFSDSNFDKVLSIPANVFTGVNFTRVCFNNATTAGSTPFKSSLNLTDVILPSLKTASDGLLFGLASLTNLNISNVETLGIIFMQSFVSGNFPVTTINIPKCTSFTGSASTLKNMFNRARAGIIININVAMSTNNSGAPDFDIVWAINNKSAIVNYIT